MLEDRAVWDFVCALWRFVQHPTHAQQTRNTPKHKGADAHVHESGLSSVSVFVHTQMRVAAFGVFGLAGLPVESCRVNSSVGALWVAFHLGLFGRADG